MKYIIVFIASFLLAFEVEFNEEYKTTIFPDTKAILLISKKPANINYSPKIYTNQGIVLLDYDNADQFVRNELYFDGKIKDIKVALFDIDKTRSEMIDKLNKYYKNCKLKKIIFLNSSFKELYFKPTTIKLTAKIVLDCK